MKILRLALPLRAVGFRAFAALADRRVPRRLKFAVIAAILFIFSPLNVLGDIPLLGMVDDVGLLLLVLGWFTRVSSPYLTTIDL